MDLESRLACAMAIAADHRRRSCGGSVEPLGAAPHCPIDDAVVRDLVAALVDEGRSDEPAEDRLPRVPSRASAERFAHFRLVRELGRGGMGVVHLAFDARLDREVALKYLHPELQASLSARIRFARETRAAARLDHPNVCPVFETGEHDGLPYMVMPLLRGETWAEAIAGDRAPTTVAEIRTQLRIVERVARALQHAHDSGLIHRDVKPGNVMLREDGEPLVLDFGLVHDDEDAADLRVTLSGQHLGTPCYMAPEQVAARGPVDHRIDVYALGVAAFEALTGVRPFDAHTRHELFNAILDDPTPDPRRENRRLSRDTATVIQTAMRRAPERRYATARDLADDVRCLLEHRAIRARRPGPVRRLGRWTRRNRAAASSIGVLVTALVVILVLLERARWSRQRFDLLAGVVELETAIREADALPPIGPDAVPALRGWIEQRGEPLARRLVEIERLLDELPEPQAGAAGHAGSERFLRDTLSRLVVDLKAFVAPETGLLASVRERAALSETILERSVDAQVDAWRRARAAVLAGDGVRASRLYRGLDLKPQVGLVPLGADPATKLWEFAHLASGEPPRRTDGGALVVGAETGVVLVLVPGGRFAMGAQSSDPQRPGYCAGSSGNESDSAGATVRARLAPFFLSKYELTQGQWLRIAKSNPSRYAPGVTDAPGVDPRHPVENVSHDECATMLRRVGLALPTEAQWEYAARAGSPAAWWTGNDVESLRGAANLADACCRRGGFPSSWDYEDWLDDGHAFHAPVGSFRPNAFGLHDVAGNVFEWCADWHGSYDLPPRPEDGLRETAKPAGYRTLRGGSWGDRANHARSAFRGTDRPQSRTPYLGVRPARPLAE